MTYIYNKDELYHFGIKGQKWGVRNYQNPDGSYTSKGQAENGGHGRYTNMEEYDSNNVISTNKDVSNRKTSEYYLKKKSLEKQRNIAIGIAATAAIIAGGYLTYNYIKNNKDILLKGGEYVQRISDHEEKSLNNSFYASFEEHDNKRYAGLMQNHLHNLYAADKMYVHKLLINKDIRAANDGTARKIFNNLYKDPNFKKDLDYYFTQKIGYNTNIAMLRELSLRWNGHGSAYEGFNRMLADHEFRDSDCGKIFFEKLKDLGYNAIVDVNDKKYSGYSAKAPLIIFDNNSVSLSDVSVKDISEYVLDKEYTMELGRARLEHYAKMVGSVGITAIGVSKASEANKTQKKIDKLDSEENAKNEKH